MDPSTRAIVVGMAGFLGATGIFAAVGFLVQQSFFLLIGLPYPPFSTLDYLRAAGIFFFDVFVLIVLIYGSIVGIVVVGAVGLFAIGIRLWPPRCTTRQEFDTRYERVWGTLVTWYGRALHGRGALAICLIALVGFTFYYHYPVFAQRYITSTPVLCDDPSRAPLPIAAVVSLWRVIDCHQASIGELILHQDKLSEVQAIYRNGVLIFLVLMIFILSHPYNQFTIAGHQYSRGKRFMWTVTGILALLTLVYLPGGYAVLFRDKQAPIVHVTFKDTEDSRQTGTQQTNRGAAGKGQSGSGPSLKIKPGDTWRDSITNKGWYLLFQNEKEVWLFRWPSTVILQKDQLGTVQIGRRQWIFPDQ